MNKVGCSICEYTGFAAFNIPCACSDVNDGRQQHTSMLQMRRLFVSEIHVCKGSEIVDVKPLDMWPHWIKDGTADAFETIHGRRPTHVRIHPDHQVGLIRRLTADNMTLSKFEECIGMKIKDGTEKNVMLFEASVT